MLVFTAAVAAGAGGGTVVGFCEALVHVCVGRDLDDGARHLVLPRRLHHLCRPLCIHLCAAHPSVRFRNVCGCTCGIRDPDDRVACGRAPAVLWVLDRVPRFNAAGTCAVCAWRRACGLCSHRVRLSEQPSLSVTLATLWSRCVPDRSTRLLLPFGLLTVGCVCQPGARSLSAKVEGLAHSHCRARSVHPRLRIP